MNRAQTLGAALAVACFAGSAAIAQTVLFDAGPPKTVFDVTAQQSILLGLSSGEITSAGFPQRWLASPFTLAANSHISEIDVYGFDPADTSNTGLIVGFTNFHYIVWRRNAGNPAPTAADQVTTGTVPATTVGQGQSDPRSGFSNMMLFPIPVSVDLPAGNYYLTVYGGEPTTAGMDANFAWFINAQLDTTLTPPNTPIVLSDANGPFAWRSQSFPGTGFLQYRTTAFTIDPMPPVPPDPQDPQYFYNAAFFLVGTTGGPTGCYANCDNSTNPPILNVNDFICFQAAFATGCTAP